MDEEKWLTCRDPGVMLNWLTGGDVPPPSARKLRLFGCACARQIWDRLTDGRLWTAVEVAERFADSKATAAEAFAASHEAGRVWSMGDHSLPSAVASLADPIVSLPARLPALLSHMPYGWPVRLLRDIQGNPFTAPAVCQCCFRQLSSSPRESLCGGCSLYVCCACCSDHGHFGDNGHGLPDCEARRIAQACYEGRCSDRHHLAILADAIEESGCPPEIEDYGEVECPECEGAGELYGAYHADDGMEACERCDGRGVIMGDRSMPNPLLAHLREPGFHARGCWAVDYVLGRQ